MDILILAVIAGIILYRLYTTLGQKTGFDDPENSVGNIFGAEERDVAGHPRSSETSRRAEEVEREAASYPPHIQRGLNEIRRLDTTFSLERFREGATKAFEMILQAFAAGDRKALKPLLSAEVFETFESAIAEREENGEVFENTLVSLSDTTVEHIAVENNVARIRVEITSEQIPVLRDQSGAVLEGNPEQIDEMIDTWVFERNLRSFDPNWMLVQTDV